MRDFDAELALVLEPTAGALEVGCVGTAQVEVTFKGKSAHSARPWQGKNAVEAGAQWLTEITRHPVTPHTIQGLEFRETLQVTTVRAGGERNVIPAEMVVNLNHRFPPDRTTEQAIANLRKHVPQAFGFEVVDRAEPGEVCADHAEVKRFVRLSGAKLAGKQGWTDVARFTAAGVPAALVVSIVQAASAVTAGRRPITPSPLPTAR